jgi:hypothetical protein
VVAFQESSGLRFVITGRRHHAEGRFAVGCPPAEAQNSLTINAS